MIGVVRRRKNITFNTEKVRDKRQRTYSHQHEIMRVKEQVITILMLLSLTSFSQELKIVGGIGLPDLLHVGIGASVSNKNEIGFYVGTIFTENTLLASTLEHRLYFKKSRKYQNLNTWFFGQRLTYSHEKSEEYKWNTIFLNLSIGRNIYFSERSGMSFDTGILAIIFDKQFSVFDDSEVITDAPVSGSRIFANLRIQFFYRL